MWPIKETGVAGVTVGFFRRSDTVPALEKIQQCGSHPAAENRHQVINVAGNVVTPHQRQPRETGTRGGQHLLHVQRAPHERERAVNLRRVVVVAVELLIFFNSNG